MNGRINKETYYKEGKLLREKIYSEDGNLLLTLGY